MIHQIILIHNWYANPIGIIFLGIVLYPNSISVYLDFRILSLISEVHESWESYPSNPGIIASSLSINSVSMIAVKELPLDVPSSVTVAAVRESSCKTTDFEFDCGGS